MFQTPATEMDFALGEVSQRRTPAARRLALDPPGREKIHISHFGKLVKPNLMDHAVLDSDIFPLGPVKAVDRLQILPFA